MSNGVIIHETMLAAKGEAGSSNWFAVSEVESMTIQITGINGDTVQVHGSNAHTLPAAATDGIVLDSVTVDDIRYILGPINFVKVKISTYSAGSITAILQGL